MSTRRLLPNRGSLFYKMLDMVPGQAIVLPAESREHSVSMQRMASSESRWPGLMKGRKYTTGYLVGVSMTGEIFHLTRIERVT